MNGDAIEVLQKGNRKRAEEMFKPLCELATALEPYTPCKEAAECQEALKQCLSILSGVLPHMFSECVEFAVPSPKNSGTSDGIKFYLGHNGTKFLKDI